MEHKVAKEILINHDEISDSQTISKVMTNKFKEQGLDIHQHEVEDLQDDDKKGVRKLRVKNTQYFVCPAMPWHQK